MPRHPRRPARTARSTASSSVPAVTMSSPASRRMSRRQLGVGAHDAHDERHAAGLLGARLDEATRDLVAAGDAAEDVDEDGLHGGVGEDEAHGLGDLVRAGAAADVEEVGRLAAGALDEVHRRHGQAGAVDHAADVAVEPDEAEAGRARRDVGRILLVEVAHGLVAGVAARAPNRRA